MFRPHTEQRFPFFAFVENVCTVALWTLRRSQFRRCSLRSLLPALLVTRRRGQVPDQVADRFCCPLLSTSLPGTASGENPAPGTGVRSAFAGSTPTISFLMLIALARAKDEILAVPQRKHSLGLGAAATRSWVPRQTGRKREPT